MSFFTIRQKLLLLAGTTALWFPLVRSEYLQYRFLGHDLQPELEARYRQWAPQSVQTVIDRLKLVRFLSWNVITPAVLFASMSFHCVRLMRHFEGMTFKRAFVFALGWSIVPSMIAFVCPFYLYVYLFVAPRPICKRLSLDYLEFILDQKDPSWRRHVALLNNGNIVPLSDVQNDSDIFQSMRSYPGVEAAAAAAASAAGATEAAAVTPLHHHQHQHQHVSESSKKEQQASQTADACISRI